MWWIFLLVLVAPCSAVFAADSRPVLDTARSPHARLHGVPVQAVKLGEGFWTPRRKVNLEVSLPTLLQLFEEKGILDNFRRISGRKNVARRGPLYTDSDVYKWLEAVAFAIQAGDAPPKLKADAESVIDEIAAAQEPSGYLNTFYSKENLAQRHQNMRHGHELYCLGHLIQAGIAWDRATGDRKLLDAGVRMVEYLIREFGPEKKIVFEGHPEIELALVELYRHTGEQRYLGFAGYLLESDNRLELAPRDLVYLFTGKPFRSRTKLEGHAVRAMYACSGATDYYLETGDQGYRKTLESLWDDMNLRKIYLTGGVGSRASGEAFGEPYELPNQQAYTESCAAIATMFWNWRMVHVNPDARYMDLFERALYNGANSGLSLGGNLYCYRNPLELVGNPEDKIRNPWYDTTCCPPNLQRILASLPGYFYSTAADGVYAHLYHPSTLDWKLEDGTPLKIVQNTKYPWDGIIEMEVSPAQAKTFTLHLRIPAWAPGAKIIVNGQPRGAATTAGSYEAIEREWKPGDKVRLTLPMKPRLTVSNPRVRENLGRAAVERGPLVYCMEGLDQPESAPLFDWWLDAGGGVAFTEKWEPGLLGGVLTLKHRAYSAAKPTAGQPLYAPRAAPARGPAGVITLVPYYTFANREPTPMQVWIPAR